MLLVEEDIVRKRFNYVDKNLCTKYECIDLCSKGILLPGFIDIHTHLRGLKLSYKEDEESGTKAAAKGGFTAVVDMPNTIPRVDNVQVLREKLDLLKSRSWVDYGIYVSPASDVEEMNNMLNEESVVGVKIFPQDVNMMPTVVKLIKIKNLKKLIIIHAENLNMLNDCENGFRWMCRPVESEISVISRIGGYFDKNVKIHITHITNPLTFSLARSHGFTTDTCPHYLYLDNSHEKELGCLAKVNPPLRTNSTRYTLIKILKNFDAISSDHAPHSLDEKQLDFSKCPSGISSIELVASLALNLVNLNVIEFNDVIKLLSLGPAKILGLRRWGCTYVDCIASYTVINMNRHVVVDPSLFYSKSKFSPYKGLNLRGVVVATIVRGNIVYNDGEFYEKIDPKPITMFMVK